MHVMAPEALYPDLKYDAPSALDARREMNPRAPLDRMWRR
jgi:hypothetical protein